MKFVPLPAFLDDIALRHGEMPVAHASTGQHMSYLEWKERSLLVAGALSRVGIGRGSIVGLAFPQRAWLNYLVTYIAVLRLGAIAVSLPARRAPVELGKLAALISADVIVSGGGHDIIVGFEGNVVLHSSLVENSEPLAGPCTVLPGECAEILFTSGTTGQPKPVWCSRATLSPHPVMRARAETSDCRASIR